MREIVNRGGTPAARVVVEWCGEHPEKRHSKQMADLATHMMRVSTTLRLLYSFYIELNLTGRGEAEFLST